MIRHVHAYAYVGPAIDLVIGLTAHDQTFAFHVGLTEIILQLRYCQNDKNNIKGRVKKLKIPLRGKEVAQRHGIKTVDFA